MGHDKKRRWGRILLLFLLVTILLQLGRGHFREQERQVRISLRQTLQRMFPSTFAEISSAYGLHPYRSDEDSGDPLLSPVILIHGLDDPGIIWQKLAPELTGHGFKVWILSYPNDQPVRQSAVFFAEELKRFATNYSQATVAVVGHSMGGLVTREMLTNQDIEYDQKVLSGAVPAISQFIMVGTPNHGSVFSTLRFLSEIRDQLVNAGKGEYNFLQVFFDGMGEAGIDLYPGSSFLAELNSRPLPAVEKMLIIAGVLSPWEKKDIASFFVRLREDIPAMARPSFSKAEPLIEQALEELGDGLVSVRSAALPGVELVQVQGNHLTIIRNYSQDSDRMPPAVPIIVEELLGRRP